MTNAGERTRVHLARLNRAQHDGHRPLARRSRGPRALPPRSPTPPAPRPATTARPLWRPLRRQEALRDPTRLFEFLITEAALRWTPGPGTRAAQRSHLASIATLDNVWIGRATALTSTADPFTDCTGTSPPTQKAPL